MFHSGLATGSMPPTLWQTCRYSRSTILLFSYKKRTLQCIEINYIKIYIKTHQIVPPFKIFKGIIVSMYTSKLTILRHFLKILSTIHMPPKPIVSAGSNTSIIFM